MATTAKRLSIALTKEDLRQLKVLSDYFEETNAQVIKRALTLLHYITMSENQAANRA